ncbi:hypothetical protein G7Y79_00056g090430 [Physcia stellaris]|nr:hypothetical protein G7Y79_00056g090430 [Physcia stellaris]
MRYCSPDHGIQQAGLDYGIHEEDPDCEIHQADLDIIEELRDKATNSHLLLGAVRSSAFGLVWWLLDKGAKIGSEIDDDDDCRKLLLEAIKRDDLDIVELLLERGAYLLGNPYGETSLHVAAKYGSADVVKRLLDRGADIMARNSSGYTPLHDAAMEGSSEIVSMLLDSGSDVNITSNEYGETPLHIAVNNQDIETTVVLLKHGASLSARDREENTPIHFAARYGSDDILDKLLNYVEQPSDIDLYDGGGNTALHIAVQSSSSTKVAALLEKQADLLVKNAIGRTPIHSAAQYGTPEILDLLLGYVKQTCDLDLRDKDGNTALHLAIKAGDPDNAKMLLKKGADLTIHVVDGFGRTPIHSAAQYGAPEILDLLLGYVKQTCDLDLRDKDGNTALHLAIKAENSDNAKILLKKGANFTMLNSFGESALVMALSSDEEGIRELGRQCQNSQAMYSAIPYLGDDACNVESSISWSSSKWC